MLDLQQLKNLAQLVETMQASSKKVEKAYANNNAEDFNKAKQEILESQAKISVIIEDKPKTGNKI